MLMCLHICLGCVTVNDDTAFLTPDILCTKHLPRPVAIHQLVSNSRHTSFTFTLCVCLSPSLTHTHTHTHTRTHTGHGGTKEVPLRLTPFLGSGEIAWVRVKDEATDRLCVAVFISSNHSCTVFHILTGNV